VTTLQYTGERIVPGMIPAPLFREHEARYNFALRFVKDKIVVDVASGVGVGTQHLLDAGARRVIGLDVDSPSLQYGHAEYKGCTFVVCDAAHICLADESADVVVSFETIEHLPDPVGFLKECNRVLKPGGLLICSTPNHTIYRWWGLNPFHTREFLPEEFLAILASFFVDLEVYGQRKVFYPGFVAKRILSLFLELVRLKRYVARILARKPAPLTSERRFNANQMPLTREIKPYDKSWFVRPTYILAIGRKATQSDDRVTVGNCEEPAIVSIRS